MPDFPALWRELRRVCKGAVVMTANQPFTTDAINSNRAEFRYSWVWNKEFAANFASVAFMPLRVHEDVLVFRQGAYNPQKTLGAKNHPWKPGQRMKSDANRVSVKAVCDESGMKWPKSIISVPKHTSRENLHVSQKPIGLMRYLVETYSNPGDVVLDCFAGSGSTLVAAREFGRHFIGCEMLAENIRTIHERLSQAELFAGGGGGFSPENPSTAEKGHNDSSSETAEQFSAAPLLAVSSELEFRGERRGMQCWLVE